MYLCENTNKKQIYLVFGQARQSFEREVKFTRKIGRSRKRKTTNENQRGATVKDNQTNGQKIVPVVGEAVVAGGAR
mgnify:CR=1 FL=1